MKNYIVFTCSTINDSYLLDPQKPWLYVSQDPQGNNLEPDIERLKRFPNLTIIIGNTDPYYIYSQSFSIYKSQDKNRLWKKFDKRWKKYKQNLKKWLDQQGLKNYQIVSWREFETSQKRSGVDFEKLFDTFLPQIGKFFPRSDFQWELRRLRLAFGPGNYFPSLPIPSDKILKIWIKRKFTEYMLQGLFLYLYFPNCTLLQNEKPSTLRTKMYQPLIKLLLGKKLPIIYPFGIDDIGYR